MSVTAPSLDNRPIEIYCGCDPERWRLGWRTVGCKIHGLISNGQGWKAGRQERSALTVWEAGVKEVAR